MSNRRRLSTLMAMFSQGPSSTDGAFNEDRDDTTGFTFPLTFWVVSITFPFQDEKERRSFVLLPWQTRNLCTMSCYGVGEMWSVDTDLNEQMPEETSCTLGLAWTPCSYQTMERLGLCSFDSLFECVTLYIHRHTTTVFQADDSIPVCCF